MKKRTQFAFPVNHPALAGHFPGVPIVPGVVLLDEVMHAIFMDTGLTETAWKISSVKFLSPLKPNEVVMIEHEQLANGSLKFDVLEGQRKIVTGNLVAVQMTVDT